MMSEMKEEIESAATLVEHLIGLQPNTQRETHSARLCGIATPMSGPVRVAQ